MTLFVAVGNKYDDDDDDRTHGPKDGLTNGWKHGKRRAIASGKLKVNKIDHQFKKMHVS